MQSDNERRPVLVTGPLGESLSLAELPKSDTTRWVIRRKAEVVAAVSGGLISLEEACSRYRLTVEEFLSWQESIEKSGLPGLRISHLSKYRKKERMREAGSDEA